MQKQLVLVFVTITTIIVTLLACRINSAFPPVPTPTNIPADIDAVVVDPENPDGYRLRRVRQPGEDWFPYFCDVFLWPYNEERLNYLFTTLEQNGKTAEFIPDVLYEVEGDWILVLRGEEQILDQLAGEVYLDLVGQNVRVKTNSVQAHRHPGCPSDIGFVVFSNPPKTSGKVMSGFPLFQYAGGVADVRDEEEARQHDKVLRDIADVIIEIQETQQASSSSSGAEPVTANLIDNEIVVANHTPETIYFAVFPQEDLPLIEWAPCQHPDNCAQDRIETGQNAYFPLTTIANSDTNVITIFWWHLVENSDGNGYHNTVPSEIEVEIR